MKKILIIDDDENNLNVVKDLLISYGFDVRTDSSCDNVPGLVLAYCPNLILLDIRMAGDQGIKICKELKEVHDIPILLFSAFPQDKVAFKDAKTDGFLTKPFEANELANLLKFHLN